MAFNITDANNINHKWTIDNAGKYTVTVNPETMTVNVTKGYTTGIDEINVDNNDFPTAFYDLYGRKVQNPSKGIYIRVQGTSVRKIIIK